jgi:hypothetical protein
VSDLARRAGRAGAAELAIGYWSSGDILLNRYHQDVASKGGVLLHAFLTLTLPCGT